MNLELKFDGIINRSMPFLLFSPNTFKLELSNKLVALYNLCNSNDITEFNELYMQISDMLDTRSLFDSAKEQNLESFSNRSKSYDNRLNDHSLLLQQLKRDIGNLKKKTPSTIKKAQIVKPEKASIVKPNKYYCSVCNKQLILAAKRKDGQQLYRCNSHTKVPGCNITYCIEDGTCDKCGKLLATWYSVSYCPVCKEKPNIKSWIRPKGD